jgi:hypothetical protein
VGNVPWNSSLHPQRRRRGTVQVVDPQLPDRRCTMPSLCAKRHCGRHQQICLSDSLNFIEATASWLNLLLLSCENPGWRRGKLIFFDELLRYNPLKFPATSFPHARRRVIVAGSFDVSEEGLYEFTNMKVTSNARSKLAMGRSQISQ